MVYTFDYLTILFAPQLISELHPQPAFGLQLVSGLHPGFVPQPHRISTQILGQISIQTLGQASKNRGLILELLLKFTISYDFKLKLLSILKVCVYAS
jgi:hypothetical protein